MNSPQTEPVVDLDFSVCTGRGVKVAIVDSGIDATHPDLEGRVKGGICLRLNEDREVLFLSDLTDSVGHGTACGGIVAKKAPESEIYAVKILDENLAVGEQLLAQAIRWCADNDIQVANLSLGTTNKAHIPALREACGYATSQGVILVAAQSNEREASYPAVFPNVLGVTAGSGRGKFAYSYQGGPIEFVARGDRQRLCWVKPRYIFMGGTSFAAAHLSGIVALILGEYPNLGWEMVKDLLIHHATERLTMPALAVPRHPLVTTVRGPQLETEESQASDDLNWIRRAAIYPYVKETHSLVRFQSLLPFEIVAVADPVGKGLTGKDAGEIIGIEPVGLRILPNLKQALTSADTLILGYTDQLSRLTERNVISDVIHKAVQEGKNVYTFLPVGQEQHPEIHDLATKKHLTIRAPTVTQADYERLHRQFGDQRLGLKTPVVGVFGTGPQQGKFTAQLALRQGLLALGYRVGQLGTEHQSQLFGFDGVFPMGHAMNVSLPVKLIIPYLRLKMKEIEAHRPDLIIVGGQGGTIPYDLNQRSDVYTIPTIRFLLGTAPDAFVVVVNDQDPDEYVQDTINALKSLAKGKTVALVFSDKRKVIKRAYGVGRIFYEQMTPQEIQTKIAILEERFGLPTTTVVSQEGREKLTRVVIRHFARK